ncbi:MAG: LysR family transcriptional regulator [Cognatishimia sp.]
MHNKSWDDIRFVLAVIEAGTVSGAARTLNVNHATVLRRIAAFESTHNVRIFAKSAQGYTVMPEHARVVEALRGVEDSMQFMQATLARQNSQIQGALRLTSTDTLSAKVMPEIVAHLLADFPELRLSVVSDNAHLDLGHAQVDLAVRPTENLHESLVGELVGHLQFGVFARPDCHDAWIGLTGTVGKGTVGQMLSRNTGGQKVAAKADAFLVAARLAAQGLGRAALPCFLGDAEPGLEQVDVGWGLGSLPLWVACHVDLQNAPRVQALRKRLIEEMQAYVAKTDGFLPV